MDKKTFILGAAAGAVLMLFVALGLTAFENRMRWGGLPTPNNKVQEIFSKLERHSIFPIDREVMLTYMYRGLLEGVGDPYTQYFDEESLAVFRIRTEGMYGGIGVMSIMNPETRALTVTGVFRDTPAYKAGVLAGDKIIAVDGHGMVGRPQEEITGKIRGTPGEVVRITFLRPYDERQFEIDIVRELIEVPTVSHEMLPDSTGLIRIETFDRVTLDQFNEALDELLEQGMNSLILDVRNNPGGLMSVVVHITNHLIPAGIITYTEMADGRREYHRATGDGLGLPLIVLVNGRSASASEIISAAIQESGAGTVLGTQTFGKGIVQNLMYLSDGNAIKMTIAKYYTPLGTSIHGIGVTPDHVVEMDEDLSRRIGSLDAEEDVQLQRALGMLRIQ